MSSTSHRELAASLPDVIDFLPDVIEFP